MGCVECKNEKTRTALEEILAHKPEKPLKLVYAKYRDGRMIEQIWREQQ